MKRLFSRFKQRAALPDSGSHHLFNTLLDVGEKRPHSSGSFSRRLEMSGVCCLRNHREVCVGEPPHELIRPYFLKSRSSSPRITSTGATTDGKRSCSGS